MSFSQRVKDELIHRKDEQECCRLAELAALYRLSGRLTIRSGSSRGLRLSCENGGLARKVYSDTRDVFREADVSLVVMRRQKLRKNNIYVLNIQLPVASKEDFFHLTGCDMPGVEWVSFVRRRFRKQLCCVKAFLRGAFLATGSLNEPGKGYHLEIICTSSLTAEALLSFMRRIGIRGKISQRKNEFVVYLKESNLIADFLSAIGAHVSLMEFEEFRVIKSMKNNINRVVNCETANLNKVVDASARQLEAIQLIQQTVGFSSLSPDLRHIAEMRLENPEMSLKELGECMVPRLGKSGVNYRLRKIIDIAEKIS